MEPPKNEPLKLSDMVMCGDHPSITKTELNVKEDRPEEKHENKKDNRLPMSYARISPTTSRTEERSPRAASEHTLRVLGARRLARDLDAASRHDALHAPANRALMHAALGSFRWPPYLVAVWVVVLVLTHLLHCLVTMLERALPSIKKLCVYFRTWTEESWRSAAEGGRARALAVGGAAAALHAAYCALWALHALARWAVEPLADDGREGETRVTDYSGGSDAKLNATIDK